MNTPPAQHTVLRMACACLQRDPGYLVPAMDAGRIEALLATPVVPDEVLEACWRIVLAWAQAQGKGTLPILEGQYRVWQQTIDNERG